MNTDFILKEALHMRPSSLSVREQQCYRAEKMLMRQFMLIKLENQVPSYLHAKDMKNWLLHRRSYPEEFGEITEGAKERRLLLAEVAWTSARQICLNQVEQELCEELKKEERLSLQLGRKITLEGLQMFLSVIRPKAEQDVQTFVHHLSNKLLSSFTGSHTCKRSRLALLTRLQRTTAPLVPQVVETALGLLLDEPEPLVEIRTSQTRGLASALRNRAKTASAQTGKQLADAAATCFCLDTSFTRARLLRICTSVAREMVKAVYRRFVDRSKTFHLLDFDESFVTARESVVCAIQDMEERVQSGAHNWTLSQLEKDPMASEVCCVTAAERSGQKQSLLQSNEEKDMCIH